MGNIYWLIENKQEEATVQKHNFGTMSILTFPVNLGNSQYISSQRLPQFSWCIMGNSKQILHASSVQSVTFVTVLICFTCQFSYCLFPMMYWENIAFLRQLVVAHVLRIAQIVYARTYLVTAVSFLLPMLCTLKPCEKYISFIATIRVSKL